MTQTTHLTRALAGLTALGVVACASTNDTPRTESTGDAMASGSAAAAPTGIEACPVMGGDDGYPATTNGYMTNEDWWPNQLDLDILAQNTAKSNPMGEDFDYAEAFSSLDLAAVKADIADVMTTSQDWWPADWGTYGGLFIRMAWHSAGTYRVGDGRGGSGDGALRFAPLNSWPDNANLDKSRRLLWPVKKKYGRAISWADLMVLAGNVALENAGFETFGFAGGRDDVWEPQNDIFWGPEGEWLAAERYHGDRELANPLAAVQMGLIYVNPEGPDGKPDPLAAAHDIRETFGRMAMNDEETVALIAGGHTLGKAHGAADPSEHVGPEPAAASLQEQGLGWSNSHGTGAGADAITSGLEGAWTDTPTEWSNGYFTNLFEYEWELTRSPAGAYQWTPKGAKATVPDAHIEGQRNKAIMFTTDLSLKMDPIYGPISRRFYENPDQFDAAFARAWYKLTHRDMGPVSRLLGDDVAPAQIWQDPIPAVDHALIDGDDADALKAKILDSGLTIPHLVRTAWAAAATYRDSDKRGGVNGARIRLAPQNGWAVNEPEQLQRVLEVLEGIQSDFDSAQEGDKRVSLADLIVLGGNAAIEKAAEDAGTPVEIPFTPGRTDATADMTDAEGFEPLELKADGFRNYYSDGVYLRPAEALVDKANLLDLTAPEMTVLVGGLRVLGGNHGDSNHGVFTDRPGELTNDFFVNLLDLGTKWENTGVNEFIGVDRTNGDQRWTATSVDLIFGSNSQLRALAEVYATDDADQKFVSDFAAAWHKVMTLDRFDIDRN